MHMPAFSAGTTKRIAVFYQSTVMTNTQVPAVRRCCHPVGLNDQGAPLMGTHADRLRAEDAPCGRAVGRDQMGPGDGVGVMRCECVEVLVPVFA